MIILIKTITLRLLFLKTIVHLYKITKNDKKQYGGLSVVQFFSRLTCFDFDKTSSGIAS